MADQPGKVKPISLIDMQREFIATNARLDRAIGVPEALDHLIREENPRHEGGQDGSGGTGPEGELEGKAG